MAAASSAQRSRASRLRRKPRLNLTERQWLGRYEAGLRGRLLEPRKRLAPVPVQADRATKADRQRAGRVRKRLARDGRLSRSDREFLERYAAERDAYARARDDVAEARRRAPGRLSKGQAAKAYAEAVADFVTGGRAKVRHLGIDGWSNAGDRPDWYDGVHTVIFPTAPVTRFPETAALPPIAYSDQPYGIGAIVHLGSQTDRRGRWVTVASFAPGDEEFFADIANSIAEAEVAYRVQGISGVGIRIVG